MILFLTDSARDYGADFLYDGFCALLGADEVVDWPLKPSLHCDDAPAVMDCDLRWPTHNWTLARVEQGLAEGAFSVIVVPSLRGDIPKRLIDWQYRKLLDKSRDTIVAYDAEDHIYNMYSGYADCLGAAPARYFKREVPISETWAVPLPFGYPAFRVAPLSQRPPSVVYSVEIWEWAVGGLRERLGEQLRRVCRAQAHVNLSHDGRQRLSVEQYHAQNQRNAIAVSPAGKAWGTNRHNDIVADGCCPVIERPTVEWPNAYVDGLEALYFRDEFECVEHVTMLLNEPDLAYSMAQEAQAKFLACHTTECRARTVWESVHGEL